MVQKEALYCAIGRCASRLKTVLDFETWLETTFAPEARETNPKYVSYYCCQVSTKHSSNAPATQSSRDALHGSLGSGCQIRVQSRTIPKYGTYLHTFYKTEDLERMLS